MTDKRLLCLGYGYVAKRLARSLQDDGWRVAGTFRSAKTAIGPKSDGVEPFCWSAGALDARAFDGADAILVSTPPDEAGCPALASIRAPSARPPRTLSWVGYLSTNGVYGDYGGAHVDENSELRGRSARARRRIEAESHWRDAAASLGFSLVVFRLPGIYGPGRSALDAVREGRAQRIVRPGQVFNRAHVDDIANALRASIENPAAGALFNIADDDPAPPQDVVAFACDLLNVAPPSLVPIEDAQLSESAKSFYADNKRISNALMKRALGVALKYPTYREGLRAIFDEEARAL